MVKISENKFEGQGEVVKFTSVEKGMNRTSLVLVVISTLAVGVLLAFSLYGMFPHLSLLTLYTPPCAAGGVGIAIGMVSLTSSYLRKRKLFPKSEPSENQMILNELNSWVDQAPENAKRSRSEVNKRIMDFLSQNTDKLDLSWCSLDELPDIFGYASVYTKLKDLNLCANNLTAIPEFIGNLTLLTELDLSNNNLTDIPEFIGNLTLLTKLDLSNNKLTAIPEFIGNLTLLTELDLSNNKLTAIPEFIGNLTLLTKLNLSSNRLTDIPETIGNLALLTDLSIFMNQLTALPESIGNLTLLTKLNLSSNRLTDIPEIIGNLTQLTKLDLGSNRLTAIPEIIGNLTQLTDLSLFLNQLTALPESIGNLTLLKRLILIDNNLLIGLPERILELRRNCIVSVERTGLSENVISRLREATSSENYRGPQFSFSINEHAENEGKPTEQVLTEMYKLAGKEIPDVYPDLTGKVDEEQLNAWLNRISFIADYKSGGDRQKAIVSKVIDYLEKAEKDPQFAEAFGMTIAGAAKTCGDRVALSIIHVGIAYELANFDLKAMDALGEFLVRNVWAIELLEGCARDKIHTLRFFDEIEVYLGYVMKLKDELKLSIDVEDMLYFGYSSLSEDDLSKAKDFVLEKMNSEEKYRFLIKNEKWLNALELNYGEQMKKINKQRYKDLEKNPLTWEEKYDASLIELSKSIYLNSNEK